MRDLVEIALKVVGVGVIALGAYFLIGPGASMVVAGIFLVIAGNEVGKGS